MSLQREADELASKIVHFHNMHSPKTWNAGAPGIDPWMRNTLVALQEALYKLSEVQKKIAKQTDENTENINRLVNHLNRR